MEASIYENQEELKRKDLEIRKIVIGIIFGELNNPPRTQPNAENMAAKLGKGLKLKSNRNEAQKRNICDSKLVEKKFWLSRTLIPSSSALPCSFANVSACALVP